VQLFCVNCKVKSTERRTVQGKTTTEDLNNVNAWDPVVASTTKLALQVPAQYLPIYAWEISLLFFLYGRVTFYNYDYCIANNFQERWWTFFSELSSIKENPVQIIQNPALSSWNLALGLISENKKIMCKLYKIYY